MFFSSSMFGSHWYDRLWDRIEDVAEEGNKVQFDALLGMRKQFANADTDEEVHAAREAFEDWETANA